MLCKQHLISLFYISSTRSSSLQQCCERSVRSYCANNLSIISNDPHGVPHGKPEMDYLHSAHMQSKCQCLWSSDQHMACSAQGIYVAEMPSARRPSAQVGKPSAHPLSPSHLFPRPSVFCLPLAGVCHRPPNPTQAHLSKEKESPFDQYAYPRHPESVTCTGLGKHLSQGSICSTGMRT